MAAVEWWRILAIVMLVVCSALFSGLTLGLMGLDTRNLELLTMGPFENKEAEKQAKYAKKILPVRRSGNLLLCTLLLGNVAVNALLSILLADLTSGIIGFLSSTVLIVLFGEITPQSLCARHGLMVGAYTVYIVRIFIILFYIIAKPIAMVLDCILGEELGNILSKNQMKKLFEMYEKDKLLNPDERKLLIAALEIQEKKAKNVMTPINKIYMLDLNTKLTEEKIHEIYLQGFSRIPIFDGKRDNIVGILLVRDLLVINNKDQIVVLKQLGSLIIRDIIAVDSETHIEPILQEFKKGTSHMCVVRKTVDDGIHDPYYKNLGIISLEDIIEEILQDNIEDEIDNEKEKIRKGEGLAKQKLLDLFSEKRTSKVLSDHERNAICSYLIKYEEPFRGHITPGHLEELVAHSDVINIHSLEKEDKEIEEEFKLTSNVIALNKPKLMQNKSSPRGIHIIKSAHIEKKNGKYIIDENSVDMEIGNIDKTIIKPDRDLSIPEYASVSQPDESYNDENDSEDDEGDESEYKESSEADASQIGLTIQQKQTRSESSKASAKYYVPEETLYTRNAVSDTFYLVLRGKVRVTSGKEGFKLEIGSFTSLGSKSLLEEDYKPDFSAKVVGEAKLLKITRQLYLRYAR